MNRPGEPHAVVPIDSRDYWYKVLENHQTNWALVDDFPDGGCYAYLFSMNFRECSIACSSLRGRKRKLNCALTNSGV